MKNRKDQKYIGRMNKVIDYIDQNLENHISLDDLCSVAFLSKYHFHRQFKEVVGMSVYKFIVARKMKRALYQLQYRQNINITDIAYDAGYETPESFSKAFKKMVGCAPSEFRKNKDQVFELDKFNFCELESIETMKVEITNFDSLRLAVMEHHGLENTVMKTVSKFIEWRKRNRLHPSKSRTFNLYYSDPEISDGEDYRMEIGAEIKGIWKFNESDLNEKVIPCCECAYVRHIGPWNTLENSVSYLYREWLPLSGREPLDFPLFIERINLFPEVPESELITDIYLPLASNN